MIGLKPVNQFIMTITIAQPLSPPQPSTNLWGEKIRMSNLYMSHRQFTITPKEKFQGQ